MESNNNYTVNDAINRIRNITDDTMKYWDIIKIENVIPKNLVSKRSHDIKALYYHIKEIAFNRIEAKMDQLAANFGFSSRKEFIESKFFKESTYPLIFKLSELREQYFQLGEVKTLNPTTKRRIGKHRMNKTEEITHDFVQKERNRIQIEMNTIKKKMEQMNTRKFNTDIAYPWLTYGYDMTFVENKTQIVA